MHYRRQHHRLLLLLSHPAPGGVWVMHIVAYARLSVRAALIIRKWLSHAAFAQQCQLLIGTKARSGGSEQGVQLSRC